MFHRLRTCGWLGSTWDEVPQLLAQKKWKWQSGGKAVKMVGPEKQKNPS